MRVPRIYTAQNLHSQLTVELEEAPSHYLSKVLRMQVGRPLLLFNGKGGEYHATLHSLGKKHVSVSVGDFVDINRQSPLPVELAIGVSRGERMDWIIQKATELGVTNITPLITARTEVKLSGQRQEKKQQHWQQIIISACEQCQRNTLATLNPVCTIDNWFPQVDSANKFILHPGRDCQSLQALPPPRSITLLVGPEGGFAEEEIAGAQDYQFSPLTLGPRILRTETAPVAALSIFQFLWGDLGP